MQKTEINNTVSIKVSSDNGDEIKTNRKNVGTSKLNLNLNESSELNIVQKNIVPLKNGLIGDETSMPNMISLFNHEYSEKYLWIMKGKEAQLSRYSGLLWRVVKWILGIAT